MTIEHEDADRLLRFAESEEVEQLFRSVGGVVGGMLMREYGMSEAAVEAVLQDVFNGYVASKHLAEDPRAWLTAEILARATAQMRLRGVGPEADSAADARHMLDLIHTQAALATLPKSAREALVLLFHKQKSYEEIAEELGVTVRYAQRLVTKAMKQLRAWRPHPGPRD